jgi:hypothetical protein
MGRVPIVGRNNTDPYYFAIIWKTSGGFKLKYHAFTAKVICEE